jgi:hypothetical protein
MSARVRQLITCALVVVWGCSGGVEPSIMPGDSCRESEVEQTKCGKALVQTESSSLFGNQGGEDGSGEQQDAVLQCVAMGGDYIWAVLVRCDFECKKAQCQAAPAGGDVALFTDSQGPRADAVSDQELSGDSGTVGEDQTDDTGPFCEPGQIACEDEHTKKTCNWFGTEWEMVTCEPTEGCDLGYCKEQICTPWELGGECVGPTSYSRCDVSGTKWASGYCEAPKTCYQGMCVDLFCPPDEIICKGMTAVQQCQQDAEGKWGWAVIETCQGGLCQKPEDETLPAGCVSACEVNLKDNSYLGCDYWAVDLDNIEGGQYEPVAIVVSVPTGETKPAEITITNMSANPPVDLTPDQLQVADMNVQPGQLKKFMMPTGYDIDGSVLNNKSLRVVSTSPVTVHQFNPLNGSNVFTNDASLLLPSNGGGEEYIVMGWPQRTSGYTLRGFATFVATQEGTTKVQVWPSTTVKSGTNVQSMIKDPPAPYDFYMEQGDVLNLETDGEQGSDLTGTRVVADQKINALAGHECANIPLGTNYCDHVEQQLFPVQTWGSHYIGDAFKPRNANQKDVWRIVAGDNNVQVNLNPQVAGPYTLNKGQWVEFFSGPSVEINATGPVLVGHFLQGSNYSGFQQDGSCSGGTGIGDPAFTLAVPAEQFLKEYIVLTPDAYKQDYVNIIAKMGSESSITIDGAPMAMALTPVGASGYGVAQVSVPDGVHTIKGETEFGVTAYGYDCDVSYAYPGGLSLKAIQ